MVGNTAFVFRGLRIPLYMPFLTLGVLLSLGLLLVATWSLCVLEGFLFLAIQAVDLLGWGISPS